MNVIAAEFPKNVSPSACKNGGVLTDWIICSAPRSTHICPARLRPYNGFFRLQHAWSSPPVSDARRLLSCRQRGRTHSPRPPKKVTRIRFKLVFKCPADGAKRSSKNFEISGNRVHRICLAHHSYFVGQSLVLLDVLRVRTRESHLTERRSTNTCMHVDKTIRNKGEDRLNDLLNKRHQSQNQHGHGS